MSRVIGLYRTPWFPFMSGKLKRIEEMLSYQGKVVSVDQQDKIDMADMADSEFDDHDDILDESTHSEFGVEDVEADSPATTDIS